MIKISNKVKFNKFHYERGNDVDPNDMVVGEVVYINEPHRYFTAEYEAADRKWKMSFNFNDLVGLGRNGHVQIVR